MNWIILTYKVPPEPVRKRMALWRKIKGLGALYLQNGICLLPKSDEHVRKLRMLDLEIAECGGEAVVLETVAIDQSQQQKLVSRFNEDRNEAYREFLEQCDVFEGEISKERAAKKFTFAELEENDENLKKLQKWIEKIRKLDFFTAELSGEATRRLEQCEATLDAFGLEVFNAHEESRGGGGTSAGVDA